MLALAATSASAQQYRWVPGANPLNWDPATVNWDEEPFGGVAEGGWVNGNPTSSALFTNFFPGVGVINVGPNVDVNSLVVTDAGFSFTGGNINFIGANGSIVNASGGNVNVGSSVSATDALIITGGSAVTLNGPVNGTNNLISFGAGSTVTMNGAVGLAGAAAVISNGSGANMAFNSTLGALGNLVIVGGNDVGLSGTTTVAGNLTISDAGTIVTSTAGLSTGTGIIVANGGAGIFAGSVSGAGGLTVTDGALAVLNGANTFTGDTIGFGAGAVIIANGGSAP